MKRETAATTAFGNVAIPHSADMDAVKTLSLIHILYLILNFNTLKNRFVLLIFVIERTDLFSFSHFLLASAEHAEQLRQTEAPAKLIHALGLPLIVPAVLAV